MGFDADALNAIAEEADRLIAEGRWTKVEFDRLWKATDEASGGQDDVFEGLIRRALPGWL